MNVCIDVDLTLVDENGELLPGAVDALTTLRAYPCELTLWSAAGAEYAKSVAARHNLEGLFTGFAGKPDLAIEDDPQSLVLRRMLHKQPGDHWNVVQQAALAALREMEDQR